MSTMVAPYEFTQLAKTNKKKKRTTIIFNKFREIQKYIVVSPTIRVPA
jgi:hypothetical protein